MSIPRQSVREYLEAGEKLLKLGDLTDAETEAVQEMLDRLASMIGSMDDGRP
jgi:hypothetical protein